VENYFTDSLFYLEINKVAKKALPNDIGSGNEADFKSEEDMPATLAMEPIVAYLNDPDCNNSTENDGEWVLNENIAFNYSLFFDDVTNQLTISAVYFAPTWWMGKKYSKYMIFYL